MRPPRISFIGGIYHVTVRCNNREFHFREDEDFQLYMEILEASKEKYDVEIHAYCLTSNHVHLVVGTPRNNHLSKFMQYLNGNFAQKYNKKHGRTGHLWGERFHSTVIESDTQLFNTILYVEANMVRCGVVSDPAKWRWCSYNGHAHGADDPVLDYHPMYLDLGKTPEERQFAFRKITEDRIQERGYAKDLVLSKGIIVGSENFVRDLIEKYGQTIRFYFNHKIYALQDGVFSLNRASALLK